MLLNQFWIRLLTEGLQVEFYLRYQTLPGDVFELLVEVIPYLGEYA